MFPWGFIAYVSPVLFFGCVLWYKGARLGSDVCFEVVYVCERHGEVWKLDIPNGGLPVHSGGM